MQETTINNDNQVKSKKRVTDHGEVFTNQREVNAMLDLVKHETERIDSRFLEPACGNGNFLAEVLRRKLAVVDSRYSKSQVEWERYSVIAVSSIMEWTFWKITLRNVESDFSKSLMNVTLPYSKTNAKKSAEEA